ncbi:MAG: Rpn family recombination-promoting nuclease/putative transposase [Holdemanella biformis]|uniref:Rpn family recombination-promoting nuclease/putative transposase n=1 Tax=Holdemanella biformis TaxID=1735 RepID=UPI002432CAA5|nr:Rpn family recombination-promoting nuclease/putative transposase [Holdemanella biformis]MBS6455644.1 Rpn family recombination-promoting nuclease/putative transposase [Holdemanella biformis]
MRNANLLNDFAFKYVFGEDCKEANDALKSLLTVFLERKVNKVVVKNSEIVKDYSKMKSPRLDLLVEFDDRTTVDLEMQLRQTKDNLPIRFSYYLARLHGCQELEGKYYGELKETIVLVFFNVNLIDNHRMCNTFTLRNEEGLSFVEESQDRMKLRTVEMAKLDVNKPLEDMNEQEKMIYYFLNCHKGMEDSKIKVMIESDGVIQMLEKRVETISDDGWKKIIEDFQKLHENEERMERKLEIEELQRAKEEARKAMLEVNKLKQEANILSQEADKKVEDAEKKSEEADKKFEEADKKFEEANKQIEQANKQIEDANTRVNDANKRADESAKKMNQMNQEMKQMNQEMKQMIQGLLSNGMSLEFVSKLLSKSEDEIMELVK